MPGGHTRQHSQRAADTHRVTQARPTGPAGSQPSWNAYSAHLRVFRAQGGAGKGKRISAGALLSDDKALAAANSGPADGPGMGQGIMGVPITAPGLKAEPIELKSKSRQRSPLMPPDVKPVVIKEEWGQVLVCRPAQGMQVGPRCTQAADNTAGPGCFATCGQHHSGLQVA